MAVGLWAFVALVIGVLYPTFLQALKVSPNQQSLEAPYIQRNIDATRAAFGLDNVHVSRFAGFHLDHARRRSRPTCPRSTTSASGTRANDISLETVTRRQSIRSYYTFTTLSVDRYYINGKLTPVLIGARQLNSASLPSTSLGERAPAVHPRHRRRGRAGQHGGRLDR